MQMVGEQLIAASCQRVWEALNDPEILRASIPGCQTLEKETEERFTATVEVKVGPIGARFKGSVTLTDLNPPNSYTLIIEGNGGIAGSMKGSAKVRLSEADAGGTLITYEVDAQVGGRMAQLGGPLIDATAKQLSAKFFKSFGDVVTGAKQPKPAAAKATSAAAPAAATSAAPSPAPAPAQYAPAAPSAGGSAWAGVAIGLLLILVAAAAFEYGRKSAAPVIVLDSALLQQLTEAQPAEGEGQ